LHQYLARADAESVVVHLTERFEEHLELDLTLLVVQRGKLSGIDHKRRDSLFSDLIDLGSSPSYSTQGVARSPAGCKGTVQIIGIKDGNALLMLLAV
jgi:hypothetical protein